MQKTKILNEFKKLSCIKDYNALIRYVDFCLSHGNKSKTCGKTSSHHILPSSKSLPFRKYSDLKNNQWNCAELSYYEHYYAHYLLTEAINHLSVLTAFCGMHCKDVVLKRINTADLISETEFNRVYAERNKLISLHRLEIIETEFGKISRATYYYHKNKNSWLLASQKTSERMKKCNIVNLPGVKEKMRNTKSQTFIDGKNLDTLGAIRAAETMKRPVITEDGQITNIYKQSAKKISVSVTTMFLNASGEKTSIAIERTKLQKEKLKAKGKWFLLKHVFDESINQKISYADLRKISPGLADKTIDNYLGKSLFGANNFKKKNKEHLIGLYVEVFPLNAQPRILDLEKSQD